MQDWFIDKLAIHQDYPGGNLPIVGKHGIQRVDIATRKIVSETVNSLQFEGSYSSILSIRCTGDSVTVSGNPSRFNRSDNLWGFTTIDECVQVYNSILIEKGLPPFKRCTGIQDFYSADGTIIKRVSDGAILRNIDFTRNHAVGQGREHSFLRGLSTQSIGRGLRPRLYPNGDTVDWGSDKTRFKGEGSKYRYDKVYNKAKDLLTHRSKRLKLAPQEEVNYYDRLIEYCQDIGLVREEQSKKAPLLKRHGNLAYYGLCTESDFRPLLGDIETALTRLEVNHMTYQTIAEQLIEQGICRSSQSANATEAFFMKWQNNGHIDRNKSQFHVHRARLLSLGIDISIPHDVSRLPPQIRSSDVIHLTRAPIPSWYRMPTVRQLRAA